MMSLKELFSVRIEASFIYEMLSPMSERLNLFERSYKLVRGGSLLLLTD
jgi:hypothetical protein